MLLASFFVGGPPAFFNMILPMFGNARWLWAGGLSVVVGVALLAYSIMKNNNMNVRVVTAEILVFIAIFLLFINIFI